MSPDTPSGSAGAAGLPESSGIDERELIQRCIAGDASAFEPLVEKYRQRVWRLAYQVLHDREEAWDVAQEAFVRAFHSLPSFRGSRHSTPGSSVSPSTWLPTGIASAGLSLVRSARNG